MEILVLFTPLFFGPFVFVYGLGQLVIARVAAPETGVAAARVHSDTAPGAAPDNRVSRGARNLILGALLSVGLLIVMAALNEAAH